MERKYSIYKLTSPSGGVYVGLTGQTVHERWLSHVKRAKSRINHPLYNSIRKHGRDAFTVETLESGLTEKEASEREKYHISLIPVQVRYNISDGGETDGAAGAKIFWDRMNANPEEMAAYKAKLSKIKLANDCSDYESMQAKAAEWRKNNPKEAYKISRRGSRVAAKLDGRKPIIKPVRALKEKLLWKHRRDLATRRSVTKVWAERDVNTKAAIGNKISETHKLNNSLKSKEERNDMVAYARSKVDQVKRAKAASAGIKQFWVDLKKDPVKYDAYIQQRKKTLLETLEKQKS